jgi:hypothetical protein
LRNGECNCGCECECNCECESERCAAWSFWFWFSFGIRSVLICHGMFWSDLFWSDTMAYVYIVSCSTIRLGAPPANKSLRSLTHSHENLRIRTLSLSRSTSTRSRRSRSSWGYGRCPPFSFWKKAARSDPSWGRTRPFWGKESPTMGTSEGFARRVRFNNRIQNTVQEINRTGDEENDETNCTSTQRWASIGPMNAIVQMYWGAGASRFRRKKHKTAQIPQRHNILYSNNATIPTNICPCRNELRIIQIQHDKLVMQCNAH